MEVVDLLWCSILLLFLVDLFYFKCLFSMECSDNLLIWIGFGFNVLKMPLSQTKGAQHARAKQRRANYFYCPLERRASRWFNGKSSSCLPTRKADAFFAFIQENRFSRMYYKVTNVHSSKITLRKSMKWLLMKIRNMVECKKYDISVAVKLHLDLLYSTYLDWVKGCRS